MRIRPARAADAAAFAAIYAPSVKGSFVSFEERPPSAAEMRRRLRETARTHPWLCAEEGGRILGYAYACRHRERAAYRWSVEVSVYVDASARGRGVGRALYRELFGRLRRQGFVNAFAGVTLPNRASVALHESLGFRPVGVYHGVGFKAGRWRDVGWWEKRLRPRPRRPAEPAGPYRKSRRSRA